MRSRSTFLAAALAALSVGAGCTDAGGSTAPSQPGAEDNAVQFQLIRNATIRLEFAGTTFLVDPMLAGREAYPGFRGTVNEERRYPLVDLPVPLEEVLDVDAVVLTHLHEDHWDEAARASLRRDMPIFVQDDRDAEEVRATGFTDVRVIAVDGIRFQGTWLYPAGGRHGTLEMYAIAPLADRLGHSSGVVFQHPGHRSVYVAGDTVWTSEVEAAMTRYRPDVVVLNAGHAQITGMPGSIIMGAEDVRKAHQVLPSAVVVAVHLEAVNHATLTRAALRGFIRQHGLPAERVLVPEDGQSFRWPAVEGPG